MKMQNDGEWGTDLEITAAANLFQCSIICFSHLNPTFGSSPGVLQHFPPHFADAITCSSGCRHATLFLVNESGTYYSLAAVATGDLKNSDMLAEASKRPSYSDNIMLAVDWHRLWLDCALYQSHSGNTMLAVDWCIN